jgi:transposase
MHRWSEEYRAFAVETFFKNNGSAIVTQRVFRRHFDIGRNGKVPTRQTILNWVTKFRTTASIVDKKPSGRPRTVRTPENVRRVSRAFQRSPHRSAHRHSVALHLSPRTVGRILHEDLKFHPTSHYTATEGLHPRGNSTDSSKYAEENHGQCQTTCRDVR